MRKMFVLSSGAVVTGVVSETDDLGELVALSGGGLWLTEASVDGIKLAWLFVPKTHVVAEGEMSEPPARAEAVIPGSYSQSS